jgi:hypothetical protein
VVVLLLFLIAFCWMGVFAPRQHPIHWMGFPTELTSYDFFFSVLVLHFFLAG